MTARQWAALAAIALLLAVGVAALAGTVIPLCVAAVLALAALAAAVPVEAGTFSRRSAGGAA